MGWTTKRFFIIIALFGLMPLLVVFIFFFYRIKTQEKEAIKKPTTDLSREAESPESVLQKLSSHPLLLAYLRQIGSEGNKGKDDPQLFREEGKLYGYVEEFMAKHSGFEEIILKNPKTNAVYVNVPSGAVGENRPGTRIIVTVPVAAADPSPPAVLLGFMKINQGVLPFSSTGNKQTLNQANKKVIILFIILFSFIVIFIPVAIALFYARMKRSLKNNQADDLFNNHKIYSPAWPRREE